MTLIADLHTHSKFSRACSKNLDLPHMEAWAKIKGIQLLSAADFTHPSWFKELHEKLEPAGDGVYQLKKEFRATDIQVPPLCEKPIYFVLATEISLIYKKGDKVRKVHHIILAPSLEVVAKINLELGKRGNIRSDGRPILGMDSKVLLQLLLDISPDIELIPAHAWTPHFAIFGSVSGFDSVEECFEELAPHIHAFETGLSSDPVMNWRLSQNDKYALISNSDAHSPQKFGREATLFDIEPSYSQLLNALRKDHTKIAGTIEFFPEEGKYHHDGLRAEGLMLTPEETKKLGGKSPKTGKKITVGVLSRISDLADRKAGEKPPTARPFFSIIPLQEIISEILEVGTASKRVQELYFNLIQKLGSEFYILKDAPIEKIAAVNPILAEGIQRMRASKVILQPGYDGEYGIIKLFKPSEITNKKQMALL